MIAYVRQRAHARVTTAFERIGIGSILLGAAALRLLWIAFCPNEPISDQFIYHAGAKNILAGRGFAYPDGGAIGFWPVGYSGVLAGVYALLDPSLASAYAFNLLAGVACVALTYQLARELYGERIGRIAAAAMAAYPSFVALTTVLASENLYIPLSIAVVWLAVRAQRLARAQLALVVACGVVSGIATLVRPTALVFPLLIAATALLFGRSPFNVLRQSVIVGTLIMAINYPWALRNERVFGAFSFTPYNGGVLLWAGNHPGADGRDVPIDSGYASLTTPEIMALPLPARDAVLQRLALEQIGRHPLEFLRLCVARAFHTLKSETIAIAWNQPGIHRRLGAWAMIPLKIVTTLAYAALMLATALALVHGALQRSLGRRALLLLAALAVAAIPFVVVLGMDRYHLPLVPLCAILAATLALPARERVAAREKTSVSPRAAE